MLRLALHEYNQLVNVALVVHVGRVSHPLEAVQPLLNLLALHPGQVHSYVIHAHRALLLLHQPGGFILLLNTQYTEYEMILRCQC